MKFTTAIILVIVSSPSGCIETMLDRSTITVIPYTSQAMCDEDAQALDAQERLRAACVKLDDTK